MQLIGKNVVITGATSGIGLEILKKLIENKCNIVVGDICINNKLDSKFVEYVKCDVSKKEDIDNLFSAALNKFPKIDLFISNAGFAYYEKISQPDWEHIDKIFDVNVRAGIYIALKMKELYEKEEYNFVITDSAMGLLAIPGYALYSGSKFAIKGFSDAYRYELTKNQHYQVVYPIATKTNFFKNAGKDIPVAFPTQTAEKVAKKVIKGIKKNKKNIYPSALFRFMDILNRIFPFIFKIYCKVNDKKFKKWLEENK